MADFRATSLLLGRKENRKSEDGQGEKARCTILPAGGTIGTGKAFLSGGENKSPDPIPKKKGGKDSKKIRG
jgi:hypothetical protein